ncbi:MAG: CusA/CzcA family heavy metal efflux RND transporter [Burkholderiales bacterium]|nr:CusA/CzcA family heavy metal efflux RND transporter [Burkholderiales bacterium]
MIRRIVSVSLHQPLVIVLAMLVFIGGGLMAFKNLPVEAFPDVTDTQVTIITLYPGLAAEEVERQVTIPLEVALSGIPNAVRLFSHTQFGLSFMVVTFNDKVNDYFARQQVTERLRNADLPDGVQPELAALTSAISEIYRYRIRADHLGSTDLRTLQNWVMERQLKTVPGVADVVSFGGLIKTYEVQPDLLKMRDYRISLEQLSQALGKSNSNAGGGYVEHGRQQYLIRGIGLLRSAEDLELVPVAQFNGNPILVKDIARVAIGGVPRQGVAGQDADDDIVYGMVLMRKGENASVVLASVKERIDEITRMQLPPGVTIEPFYDRSWLIGRTLKTVFTNLLEGALLVSVVLYLFLKNMRAAAIVASIIPLSLLGTFLGLTWIGIPANLLSLGAMDFGIIVDGAVIVVEHIFHRLQLLPDSADRKTKMNTVLSATAEVGRPTVFSMLIIIAAHIPIFTLQRHEGRIFAPMAYSVVSALIASLLLSLTLVPLLSYWLLRGKLSHTEPGILSFSKRLYAPSLRWALAHRNIVLGLAGIGLAIALAAATRLGSEFLPELNEGSVWLNVTLEPSVSIGEAQLQAGRIRAQVRKTPEVEGVVSKLGRPEDGTDPKIASQIEALVDLFAEEDWKRGLTKKQVLAEIEQNLRTIPGITVTFSQPIRDNVLESISQIDGQIVIKITGEDLGTLRSYGQAILTEVRGIQGVSRAFIDRDGQLPQYRIDIDRARAARYGLSVDAVQTVIQTALAGQEVSYVWEGERRFAVTVRLADQERSLARVKEIAVATPGGAFVPLQDIATFRSTSGAMNIAREGGRRVLSIGVFIKDRDMGSVVKDMQTAVAATVKLQQGYQIGWSGEFEMLLFNAFGSLKNATLIIANIPFAMIGGILALYFSGIPLSVSAAIGFIALFGQAVLNGVVMLSHFGHLRENGEDVYDAVFRGSLDRLRTVLMTALLASLGLLPMALSTAIGAETQRPLAIVIIGGLITATLLTLLVLPTLYLWLHAGEDHAGRTEP